MARIKTSKRTNANFEVKITRKRSKSALSPKAESTLHKQKSSTKNNKRSTVSSRPDSKKDAYNLSDNEGTLYRYTRKQTQSWKLLGRNVHQHLVDMLNKNIRLVMYKKSFQGNEAVTEKLQDLKSRLATKLLQLRVPQKKYGDYAKVKATLIQLKEELSALADQEREVEKAIKKEERQIQELENKAEMEKGINVTLAVEVPDDVLGLPSIPFR